MAYAVSSFSLDSVPLVPPLDRLLLSWWWGRKGRKWRKRGIVRRKGREWGKKEELKDEIGTIGVVSRLSCTKLQKAATT